MSRFARAELPFLEVQAETARRLGARFLAFQAIYWVFFGPYLALYACDVFKPLGEYGPSVVLALIMPLGDAAVILLLTGDRLLGDVFVGALRLYVVMLSITLLRTLALVVGMMAFVVPGLLVAAWFSVAQVVAVGSGLKDPFQALFSSRDLVRGQTIPVLLAFAPLVVVTNGVSLLVTVVGGIQEGAPALWTHPVNIAIDQLSLVTTALAVVIWERLRATEAAQVEPAPAPTPSSGADEAP